jgi:hypothetical protein
MTAAQPLKGIALIDCARANAQQGIDTAARLCGYGRDLHTFSRELSQACQPKKKVLKLRLIRLQNSSVSIDLSQ